MELAQAQRFRQDPRRVRGKGFVIGGFERISTGPSQQAAAARDRLVAAVQAAGGRVLYQFRVALVRAELDTGAVRALVKGPAAIANAAFTVPDTTKFDANVQIFYDRAITDADKDTLRTLGVVEVDQMPDPVLEASVPDSLIPRIGALPGVQFVRATGWGCAAPERGERTRRP